MNSPVEVVWLLVSSGLVLLMQGGFLALETGLTRTKNNINVAIKNLTSCYGSAGLASMVGVTSLSMRIWWASSSTPS